MSMTDELKKRKATRAQGFGSTPKTTQTPTAQAQEPTSPVAPATEQASSHALQFTGAVQSNLATQLERQAQVLQGIDAMLDNAAVQIATAEQDILSGTALTRKLTALRADYAFDNAIGDASVTLEFERLKALETLASPVGFVDISDTIKRLAPADKARLDQAVLSPSSK